MKFLPEVRFTKQFMNTLRSLEYQVKDKSVIEKLKEEYIRASKKSIIDKLTGLYSRRKFDEDLKHLYSQVDSQNAIHLSVIMIDIDDFKPINDNYGHDKGDVVLQWVASTIKKCLRDRPGYRESGRVYRYGGEEFVVLLPNTTSKTAYIVAERIRRSLDQKTDGRITASLGTSNSSDKGCSKGECLVKMADEALYRAKHGGKNRIIVNDKHQFEFLHLNAELDESELNIKYSE